MSEALAQAIVSGVVTIAGAIVSGVVAVMIVKIRRDVKTTTAIVEKLPAHVTTEAKRTRAAIETVGTERRRRRSSDFPPAAPLGPDDVTPTGSRHRAERDEQ